MTLQHLATIAVSDISRRSYYLFQEAYLNQSTSRNVCLSMARSGVWSVWTKHMPIPCKARHVRSVGRTTLRRSCSNLRFMRANQKHINRGQPHEDFFERGMFAPIGTLLLQADGFVNLEARTTQQTS
jgi:hypothetical protein